ncbi:MAG: hypothetical protein AAFR27_15140 [Pseudomonadota bacterium]
MEYAASQRHSERIEKATGQMPIITTIGLGLAAWALWRPSMLTYTIAGLVNAVIAIAYVSDAYALDICTGGDRAARKVTCLVDGDTGWQNGVKWRLEGVDTPEYRPKGKMRC